MTSMPPPIPVPSLVRTGRTRRFLVLSLAVLALASTAQSTEALSVGWCRSDPVVAIDGNLADVFVAIPLGSVQKVSGATEIVITTPEGVSAVLIASGVGYGYGELVTFAQSPALRVTPQGIQLLIEVYLPATLNSVPMRVEFAPRVVGVLSPAVAEGTANKWISLRTML